MGKYLNKLYFMMAAMVTSYVVNMMYHMDTAIAAAITCPNGTSCQTMRISWNCESYNGHIIASEVTNGTVVNTPYYATAGGCNHVLAADVLRGTYIPGYAVQSCWSDNGGAAGIYAGRSGRASCAYTSCVVGPVSPSTKTMPCGVVTMCGATTMTASCFTAQSSSYNAGFLVNGGKGCECCANSTGSIATYKPIGMSNVFSIYNAAARTSCYIIGQFEDEKGLFEFTDSNRCYYAS